MPNVAYNPLVAQATPAPAPVFDLAVYRRARESWNILLVEDDPSDAMLAENALNAAAIPHTMRSITNGSDALTCLNGKRDAQVPDLVFLDLSLPDKDGFELLAEISAMPLRYRSLPFVILTGFEHYRYITHTYDLWIPAYLTKPCTVDKVREAFSSIFKPGDKAGFTPVRH